MKEMKVNYTLKKTSDKYSVLVKSQGVSDANTEEVFSLILANIISAFKESGAPKGLTKEMMNKAIDAVYELHPKHFEE